MPRVYASQTNFSGGEWSPLVQGRIDSDRYRTALGRAFNYIPAVQGSLLRRPGSAFVGAALSNRNPARLIPFRFSNTQSYMLCLNQGVFTFYRNYQVILASGGAPVTVAHPYADADLPAIKYTQSADVLYLVHPKYPPAKLSRLSETNWVYTPIDFQDGPYLPINTTTTTLTPSAATGTSVTITASATAGINGGQGFLATDVGRLIRIQQGSTWGWAKIKTWGSATSVGVEVFGTLTDTAAKAVWRLGLWSATTGYPACAVFHEDRLFLAGAGAAPQRMDGSRSSGYEDFKPTDADGTIKDNHAVGYNLNSDDIHAIQWMISDEKGLIGGTLAGEWVVTPSTNGEALTPTNVKAKQVSRYGSKNIQPVQAGRAGLFVQTAGRKVREFTYFYDVQGFRAPDLSEASEHMTTQGILALAYQKEPQPVVWVLRGDGSLASITYRREDQGLIAAWASHELGGLFEFASPPVVESIAAIPNPDGTRDDLWLVVKRSINGASQRYLEVLNPYFDGTKRQENASFLDCSLVYDNPKQVGNWISLGAETVLSLPASGLVVGDKIRLSDVRFSSGNATVNDLTWTVKAVAGDLHTIDSGFDTGTIGGVLVFGTYRKLVSTITGLDHLNGEFITAYADGAAQKGLQVLAGAVQLKQPAAVVAIGYAFQSEGSLLRIEAGSADGAALGKTRRIHKVRFLLHRTLGFKIGPSFQRLTEYVFRKPKYLMGNAVPLYSGLIEQPFDADYDQDNFVCWRQDGPYPGLILAVLAHMDTQDG